MKDAVERIVNDGKSILLSQLADTVIKRKSTPSPYDTLNTSRDLAENVVLDTTIIQSGMKEGVVRIMKDEDLFDIDSKTAFLQLVDNTCNHRDIERCSFEKCKQLKELVVGNDCLQNVKELVLSGYMYLEKVEIGARCFISSRGGGMEVSDCKELRSFKVGAGCCVDWSSFVMKNCGVVEVSIGDGCFVNCENTVFESGYC